MINAGCGAKGEGCTLIETTLVNPASPGTGSSTDINLIPPYVPSRTLLIKVDLWNEVTYSHSFSVPSGFGWATSCHILVFGSQLIVNTSAGITMAVMDVERIVHQTFGFISFLSWHMNYYSRHWCWLSFCFSFKYWGWSWNSLPSWECKPFLMILPFDVVTNLS